MIPAYSYEQICVSLKGSFESRYHQGHLTGSHLVGLLFAPPNSEVGRDDVVPRLDDYHHRSGNVIDFFCAGYGAYWPPGWVPDERVVGTTTDPTFGHKTEWQFSAKHFHDLRAEIQEITKGWRYSGEADLLLANAVYDTASGAASIDFGTTVDLRLQQLKIDDALETVPELFERIVTFAENHLSENPAWSFSDSSALELGRSWLASLPEKLPLELGKVWKRGRHYAVHDFSHR
jgi:hypothetical protein